MIDYTEHERMFAELMQHADLSMDEKKEVQDWLDHNEYGLALETIVDILVEHERPVPKEIIQRIKVLAIHMEMTELSLSGLAEIS